ncbi:MAG: ribosome biogenesis GTPase YlqF [Anaerovoracaceae bacterium]|jgi:ribosome biogenesis GTPase A
MIEHINWYPGHMKKTRALIRDNLRLVDCVVELLDARIPVSSRNPVLDELIGGKPRLTVLNKADLADEAVTERWLAALRGGGEQALAMNCLQGKGGALLSALSRLRAERGGRRAARPFRMMVVGVPNVGKSSLLNRLTGRRSTRTGSRPGVTRGKQWLTLRSGMQLLDTPGILWPKFEDPQVGLHLAFCGAIKDDIVDPTELALELLRLLTALYPQLLRQRYGLAELPQETAALLEAIAARRGFLLPGGRVDTERCARTVLDEFRRGVLGRITLERPQEEPREGSRRSGTGREKNGSAREKKDAGRGKNETGRKRGGAGRGKSGSAREKNSSARRQAEHRGGKAGLKR